MDNDDTYEASDSQKAIFQKDDTVYLNWHEFRSFHFHCWAKNLVEMFLYGSYVSWRNWQKISEYRKLMIVNAGYSFPHQRTVRDTWPYFWLTAQTDCKLNCHAQFSSLLSKWWQIHCYGFQCGRPDSNIVKTSEEVVETDNDICIRLWFCNGHFASTNLCNVSVHFSTFKSCSKRVLFLAVQWSS